MIALYIGAAFAFGVLVGIAVVRLRRANRIVNGMLDLHHHAPSEHVEHFNETYWRNTEAWPRFNDRDLGGRGFNERR